MEGLDRSARHPCTTPGCPAGCWTAPQWLVGLRDHLPCWMRTKLGRDENQQSEGNTMATAMATATHAHVPVPA